MTEGFLYKVSMKLVVNAKFDALKATNNDVFTNLSNSLLQVRIDSHRIIHDVLLV